MAKIERTAVKDATVLARITAHVTKEFKSFKGIEPIIEEGNGVYYVYKHRDGSPVILGKNF